MRTLVDLLVAVYKATIVYAAVKHRFDASGVVWAIMFLGVNK